MFLDFALRALVWLSLFAVVDERQTVEFTNDALEIVQAKIGAKKAVLVDVRSQEEWDQGHIKGSIFLPVTSLRKHSLDSKKLAKTLPKKKVLYTYCAVGMRAKAAAKILEAQGYQVRALRSGYEDLVKAGFKSAKPQAIAAEGSSPAEPSKVAE